MVVGEAEAVEDGLWQIVLTAEETAELPTGVNRLEVIAASKMVSIPTFESMQFVSVK